MLDFYYKAVNKSGEEKEGVVHATSYKDAFLRIKRQGFYPTEIFQDTKQEGASHVSSKWRRFMNKLFRPRVKTKHLAPLVSDLSVLIDAGIALVRSLAVLEKQTKGYIRL